MLFPAIFAFVFCLMLINKAYNKKHSETIRPVVKEHNHKNQTLSFSFQSLMEKDKLYLEESVNPVVVEMDGNINPYIAIRIAAKNALEKIKKIKNNDYVNQLIALVNQPQYFKSKKDKHRGVIAKVQYVYSDNQKSPEFEMLYSGNNVDFSHKDWYSI